MPRLVLLRSAIILGAVWFSNHAAATTDPGAWDRLETLTHRDEPVERYRARFVQRKFTPLLGKPIESRGTVRIDGAVSRWDTEPPHASTMRIEGGRLEIWYPAQHTLEIYELGDRLDAMAASPVPDLERLRENFTIDWMETGVGDDQAVELLLLPRAQEVAEAIEQVRVRLDPERRCLVGLAVTDLDGETTELTFDRIEFNPPPFEPGLGLDLPDGIKVVRPLEAVGE